MTYEALTISLLVIALLMLLTVHIFLHVSLSTKVDAAIDRLAALLHVQHASTVAKIAAIPVAAADIPTVTWTDKVAPVVPITDALEILGATSKQPVELAHVLNLGGANAIALALTNLLATESTPEHRLGLLFDGTYGERFVGFCDLLTPTMQGVIQTRLEAIPNTEELRARLDCNPTLRYDGNGNFTAIVP